MRDVDAGERELTGETQALHSRITKLEQVSHNLPGHKNVDEELDRAWREWKSTFDAIKDSIILTDGEFKIIQANLASSQFFGRPLGQVIGKTCWQLVHGTDRPPKDCPLEKAKTTKKHEEIELYLPQKGIWVAASVNPVFDQQGNLTGAIHILRDITDRKQAEELLRESKDFSENLIASMRDGFSVVDPQGVHIQVNPALCQMTGFSKEELLGTGPPHPYWPQEEYQHIQSAFQRTLKGDFNDFELVFKRKSGECFPVILSPSCTRDKEGNLKTYCATIKDITDRKQAEELLRRERDRAQKYLDVAGVMLVAVDAEQRVGLINKKGCEILGYSEEEVIAKNWFDNFLPEKVRGQVKAVFEKIVSEELDSLEYYENPILTKNGDQRLIAWRNTVLRDDKGQFIATLSSGEDITKRKEMEEVLRESEEKYRVLVENSPNLVAIYQDDTLKYVNQIMCEKLGWTFQEMTSPSFNPVEKIIPQRFQSLVKENIAKRLRRENVSPYEVSIKTRDGSEIPVIVKGQRILYLGKPAYEVIHIDITERKLAEEAIKESERKLKVILDKSPIHIWAFDGETYNYLNKAYTDFTGLESTGHLTIESWKKYVHPDDMEESGKIWMNAWKNKSEHDNFFRLKNIEGEYRDFWCHAVPVFDENGKFTHFQGYNIDITERKKAEQEIAKLAKFPEENPLPILRVSAEGTVLYSNKPGLVLLDAWGCQVGQQLPAYVQRLVADALSSGHTTETETKCGDRVFSVRFVSIAGSNYVNVYGQDITERKKAEQKLLEDQTQLKSLASQLTLAEERERRRLATELHDRISQALVISKIKLDALRKSGRSRKLDKALEDICNSIGQTIQDTRTLTFDLGSPVLHELGFETAVSEWLTSQIQGKHGITVKFEDDGEPKPLDDDVRILLFRDVRELLINVVKHAGAHKVKVSIKKLGDQICVMVEDDGVGFDLAEVLSGAAKRGGFGLFSIRGRLDNLGGHLQIDSAPSLGCKVTMAAPLKRKEITDGRNKTTR